MLNTTEINTRQTRTNSLKENEESLLLNVELNQLKKNGIVLFNSTTPTTSLKNWNGNSLKISEYGIYKVSLGFSIEVIEWFFNQDILHLSLLKNEEEEICKTTINEKTKCYYSVKSSQKTITLLLREGETLSLKAEIEGKDNPNIKDIFLKIRKLPFDEISDF